MNSGILSQDFAKFSSQKQSVIKAALQETLAMYGNGNHPIDLIPRKFSWFKGRQKFTQWPRQLSTFAKLKCSDHLRQSTVVRFECRHRAPQAMPWSEGAWRPPGLLPRGLNFGRAGRTEAGAQIGYHDLTAG